MSATGYLEEDVPSDQFPAELQYGAARSAMPTCEKCGEPLSVKDSLACRHCGWYASIGTYIEIDKVWEASADPAIKWEPEKVEEPPKIPAWGWVLIACVGAVVVESVVCRAVTPAGSGVRTAWSLTQLGLGFVAFVVCHFLCFGRLMSDKAETNLVDIILTPIKCWAHAVRELPRRQWIVDGAAAGLTAIVMSIVVIGGIPYERLWDWGFKQPPKQSLMAAVMEQAHRIEGEEKSLEEAIEDFAGKAGADELGNDPNGRPMKPERKEIDCVIVGYEKDEQEQVRSLILGVELYGKLVYACRVLPKLSDDQRHSLTADLSAAKSRKPYLKVDLDATWVVPSVLCRVSYSRQGENGTLYNAEFVELRGQLNIGL
jgi:hypothetical protein